MPRRLVHIRGQCFLIFYPLHTHLVLLKTHCDLVIVLHRLAFVVRNQHDFVVIEMRCYLVALGIHHGWFVVQN